MKSQCLPFSQIPHSSRLFLDFLSYSPEVRRFYPHSPHFKEWIKSEAAAVRYDDARRERVAGILEAQNRSWGASPKTLENIARLREGALAAVTGQQVGLFGGPLFALFKALSAVRLADQATASGVPCVPIFWLATADHDLVEVNHVVVPGPDGVLQTLATPTSGIKDAPVSAIALGPEIDAVVESAVALLGESDASHALRECYRAGETLGSAFARLFTRFFADWGVILMDGSDPGLHEIARPIYRAAIERAGELEEGLTTRGRELEAAGYHQQVKVVASSTLLFGLRNGARVPVHRRATATGTEFVLAHGAVSQDDLLKEIAQKPDHFSPNVLLRPVVQDYLLPTLAYTGGSAETAYFAQAGVVYQVLLGRVTPVVPRFSATIIEAKPKALLERHGLAFTDLLQGPERVREILAVRALPTELRGAFDDAEAALEKSMSAIGTALGNLDKTLVDSATHAGEKMRYQITQLRARAARAELRQSEVFGRHADLLSQSLYPNKVLQERVIGGIFFLARYGAPLLAELCEAIQSDCLDHQVVSL